ncbi:MAG: hypothetical protein ABIN67_20815 [Ferruginibacter sp.]
MSKKLISLNIPAIMILWLLVGCNADKGKMPPAIKDTTIASIAPNTSQEMISSLIDTIFAKDRDTTAELVNEQAVIKGYSKANRRQPSYSVKVMKGQTIVAIIKPVEKGGNIRINQIQLPDGTFDGPFGDSVRYTVKKSGMLRFIIGQNMMAGDPWTGDFIFRLKLQ